MSSGNEGFVLSDALISIVIVSVLATLVYSAMQVLTNESRIIRDAYEQSQEHYETSLLQIGECICTIESSKEEPDADSDRISEDEADDPDISSNNY